MLALSSAGLPIKEPTSAVPPLALPVEKSVALRWQCITDPTELPLLAPRWRQLLERSASPQPMQSPDWLIRWWRIYAGDRLLRLGLCWHGPDLVAIAPLCRRTHRHRGLLSFRRLEFLGSDVEENDGVCSEYLGVIADPSHEREAIDSLVAQILRGGFGPWDETVLSALDGDRPQTAWLAEAFERRDYAVEREVTTTAPYVVLPSTWDAFLKQLSKAKRWNLKTQLKDFDAWANGQATWHEARDEQSLAHGLAILKSLHAERWRAEGKTGAFAAERFDRFHDEYALEQLRQGNLEMIWLTVGNRPVAALYAFRAAGKVCFYQSGRVTEVPDEVRLGSVIVAKAIQRAIERGDREFDLLGGPARYKLAFTSTARPLVTLRVARPGIVETLRAAGERLMRGLRWTRRLISS